MNTAFMQALQTKAQAIQAQRNRLPQSTNQAKIMKPTPIAKPEKQELRIEFVITAKRIDLFFSPRADEKTIDLLVDAGWQWVIASNHFCNDDTIENRKFLIKHFNAKIELPEQTPNEQDSMSKSDLVFDEVSPEFATYRQQINELLTKLKCQPADLMLIAIDCLYNEHFI